MNAPPWIQNNTGRARSSQAGVYTLRYSESSPLTGGLPPSNFAIANSVCADWIENFDASSTPSQSRSRLGGCQRSDPTGGDAYGMPRKICTPLCSIPSTLPLRVETIAIAEG